MSEVIRSRFWITAITIGWTSFVAAAVATMLFFATFDPQDLAGAATYPMQLSRYAGYTIGFFLFWILTAAASTVSVFMLGAVRSHAASLDDGDES